MNSEIVLRFLLLSILLAGACSSSSKQSSDSGADPTDSETDTDSDSDTGPQSSDETLSTLTLVDPHEAYTMSYLADYRLDEAIDGGKATLDGIWEHVQSLFPTEEYSYSGDVKLPEKACTGFSVGGCNGEMYQGHNEDWEHMDILVLHTSPPEGYASVSLIGTEMSVEELLASPFLPLAGVNEMGVAIATYSVPVAQTPYDSQKPNVFWMIAIRAVLDKAASLNETIALLDTYNLQIESGNELQFFIGDAAGNSAVVAWIEGETRVVNKSGDWQAVTNFIQYDAQPEDFNCDRYQTAMTMLESSAGQISQSYGMEILEQTSEVGPGGDGTQFSVVFDQTQRELQVAFGRKYDTVLQFCVE